MRGLMAACANMTRPGRSRLVFLVLALAAIPACARHPSERSSASAAEPARSRFDAPGLASSARIVTDRYGIPHIMASNRADLFYAWGFVTARDRLWQLE